MYSQKSRLFLHDTTTTGSLGAHQQQHKPTVCSERLQYGSQSKGYVFAYRLALAQPASTFYTQNNAILCNQAVWIVRSYFSYFLLHGVCLGSLRPQNYFATSYYGRNCLRCLEKTFPFFEGLDLENVRTNFRFVWISINHDVKNDPSNFQNPTPKTLEVPATNLMCQELRSYLDGLFLPCRHRCSG